MQAIRSMVVAMALCATGAWAADGPKTQSARPAGVDLAGVDRSVKPGDDFDAYANGGWRKVTEIPADRSSTGVFFQVFQKAEQRNAQLIRDAGSGKPADISLRSQ